MQLGARTAAVNLQSSPSQRHSGLPAGVDFSYVNEQLAERVIGAGRPGDIRFRKRLLEKTEAEGRSIVEDVVAEAKRLAEQGVVEVNLISQDTVAYGRDLEGRPSLADLVSALGEVDALRWIRLHYLYPEKLTARGLEFVRPGTDELVEIDRIIMEELVNSTFKPEAVAYLRQTIEGLKQAGCDGVILGCTEIPLIIDDTNSPLPTLDSTRLLARAALRRAVHTA